MARFVGNGRHMEGDIRRAADGGIDANGVFQALAADDLPGGNSLLDQRDDLAVRSLAMN